MYKWCSNFAKTLLFFFFLFSKILFLSTFAIMSVALATAMDSNYGLRLGLAGHHHLQHLHDLHQTLLQQHHHHRFHPYQIPNRHNHDRSTSECSSSPSPSIEDNQPQNNPSETSPLKFSMTNILRPDFGREAILSCPRQLQSTHQSRSVTPKRDNASRSSPGVLSRSASLESLASNRSSLAGGGATPSICSSAASTVGAESATSDGSGATSTLGTGSGGNGLFPAWIYCTRYSDRPSSGELDKLFVWLCFSDIRPNLRQMFGGAMTIVWMNGEFFFAQCKHRIPETYKYKFVEIDQCLIEGSNLEILRSIVLVFWKDQMKFE